MATPKTLGECEEWALRRAGRFAADGAGGIYRDFEDGYRLAAALALAAQRLAEAHRAELDAVMERVKRLEAERPAATHEAHVDLEARVTALEERAKLLEEEARVLNASILDRREVAP